MQNVLRRIWSALGVPQLWGLILSLIVVVEVAFIKLFIDQAMKNQAAKFANTLQIETTRQTEKLKPELQVAIEDQKFVQSQYASIATYVREQYIGLRTAYVRLFKDEGATATREAIAKIALEVDNDIMRPFRKYRLLLDEQTIRKIFLIHNILVQFQDNPSPDAIKRFRSSKAEVFKVIYDTCDSLKPELILQRKGIIDHAPSEREGG